MSFHKGVAGRQRGFGFGGFSVKKRQGGSGDPAPSWSSKAKSEEDYFNEPECEGREEGMDALRQRIAAEYKWSETSLPPSSSSSSSSQQPAEAEPEGGGEGGEEEEEDPLEAFMAGIESSLKRDTKAAAVAVPSKPADKRAVRTDIEEEDDQESYFKAMASAPIVVAGEGEEEVELDYDSDGNPIVPERSKVIDPLPPIDHSEIDYPAFSKDFYVEHPEISALSQQEVKDTCKKLGVRVTGFTPPRLCVSFAHFGFSEELMALIRKSEFSQPTPVQSQSIPAVLGGRDVIGIAKTGSGKTAAFLWPLLVHAIDQPELQEGDGPIGLVCAPTRELCQQIYHEARKYAKAYGLTVCCVYGGGSRWEQSNALKEGCEILVATPGRLIDLVKLKATNLRRVTYLVFDEADRMFDMGFEAQVRSIANHVRPDRQTLLFSATFRKRVERLCRDVLVDPVRVAIGEVGGANTDITQVAEVMKDDQEKWRWLLKHLVEFSSTGSVLVFVTRKINSEEVASSLKSEGFKVGLLHGDMTQGDRDDVITAFKRKELPILVATDVAARGLDIPAIKTVVNFDVPRNIDTHVHRIGRTGRAGEKGTAFTLLTAKDSNFAGDLVRNLESADQYVSAALMTMALSNPRFRRQRQKGGGPRRGRGGGGGARPRARPGLGATTEMLATVAKAAAPVGPMGDASAPTGSRASFLKSAMLSEYRSKFKAASSSSLSSTSSLPGHTHKTTPTDGEGPPAKRKRKSRWD